MPELKELLEFVKNKLAIVSFFFFFYVLVYFASKEFGLANAIKTAGSIIYLPAGVRLLACLVGRAWGAIGIIIASYLVVGPDVFANQSKFFYFTLALIHTIPVFFSVFFAQKILKISEDLSNLKLIHLPLIDLLATFSQAFFYYYFLYLVNIVEKSDLLPRFISQMTGNFLGGMLFMFAFMFILQLSKRADSGH
jgi:hypothetical protein